MHPATSAPPAARRVVAEFDAVTASFDVMRESMEYATMRPEQASLMAHRYSFP